MAEFGDKLVMACMEIGGKGSAGHQHPFEQCGIVVEARRIEMFIGDEPHHFGIDGHLFHSRRMTHGWKTFDVPARLLDISSKP